MEITLISRYFDSRNRGAGIHSELIYKSLLNENIKLNTISQDDAMINMGSSRWSYYYYTHIDMKRLIKKDKYKNTDVFHSLSPIESFHLPKNKTVTSILDFIPLNYKKNSLSSQFSTKMFEKTLEKALESERLVVNNSNIKNILITKYSIDKNIIEVIPPIIDNKFLPLENKHDSLVIGTVSELSSRKRIDLLINSFLESDIKDAELLIGGSGPELENLKKISKNDERIKFLGFIPDEEMNQFYNSLDVFVFPSLTEGFGMPIVEAMACKKPVITLEDSDIPLEIKEKTCVCKKEDLSYVIQNKKYNCNLTKNYQFSKEYSSKNICNKLMKLYESI